MVARGESMFVTAILSALGAIIVAMMAFAHDIAAALRERLPGVGVKKLHKLLAS
jgi:predicted transcriptional regulator